MPMRCLDLNCCECDMCGGCEVHEHCNEDFNHVVWFTRFASPGEPVCGAMGAPRGYPDRPCARPAGHGGEFHQDRRGNGWPMLLKAVKEGDCQ